MLSALVLLDAQEFCLVRGNGAERVDQPACVRRRGRAASPVGIAGVGGAFRDVVGKINGDVVLIDFVSLATARPSPFRC